MFGHFEKAQDGVTRFSKDEKIRWDLILLFYFIALFSTGCSFGASYNAEFNRGIIFWTFVHFCAETTFAFHLICSSTRIAFWFSAIFGLIWFGQACAMVPIAEWSIVTQLFLVQFLFSDTLNTVASFGSVLNPIPYYGCLEIKRIAFGLSLHFIGVSLGVWIIPITFYFANSTFPQHGLPWVLIAWAAVPGLFISVDGLQSKLNHISSDKIQWQHNSIANGQNLRRYVALFACVLPVGVCAGAFIMALYRTTESSTGLTFASWIWDDVALATGYPVCGLCWIITVFIWARGRTERNIWLAKKKQEEMNNNNTEEKDEESVASNTQSQNGNNNRNRKTQPKSKATDGETDTQENVGQAIEMS